jgi:uncharacterized protein YdhG (YjbR/CyaY superfamily)
MSAMDDYLDGLPSEQKAALEHVRSVARDVAPGAEKGTVRFSPDRPVPDDVMKDLIQARMDEIGPQR